MGDVPYITRYMPILFNKQALRRNGVFVEVEENTECYVRSGNPCAFGIKTSYCKVSATLWHGMDFRAPRKLLLYGRNVRRDRKHL